MKGLYDIHCHILPGVDDGARNMEESLWMLNKEYQEGVRHVILTPHFRYDMFEPHMNIVTRQFMQLRRAAMKGAVSSFALPPFLFTKLKVGRKTR